MLTGTSKVTLDIPRGRQGTFDPGLIAKYQRRFPGFERKLWPEITGLQLMGAVRDAGDRLVLTPYGMRVWILIMREFFMAVSDFRDLMRHAIREEEAPGAAAALPRPTGALRRTPTH